MSSFWSAWIIVLTIACLIVCFVLADLEFKKPRRRARK